MLRTIAKLAVAVLCLAAFLVVMAPAAYADDWNKATKITVNQPFEIPGMILPAGTYIVKIVDLAAERHVVRFLSEDESKIYATLIGIPDFRLEPTENTAITFYEPEVGRARALHAWFYPGHRYGIEFAYEEKRAAEIAAVTEEHVVAFKAPEPVPFYTETPAEEPTVQELLEEPLYVFEPTGEEVEIAEVYPEVTVEPSPEVIALPRTASTFPLIVLVGCLAAGTAAGIRVFHK
jgi:hypothetical protein